MRFPSLWLCLLFSCAAALPAGATIPQRLYVFGDSYSDIGAGYMDGNGPTAVAYLAWDLGLPFTHAKAANAAEKSLDFAVSGAQSGEGLGHHAKSALIGYGMINQVQDFADRVRAGEIRFDPATTLFFIAGGLNDGRLPTETTVANLQKEIGTLKELGARHLTVALLPTKIPSFSRVGLRLNPALAKLVEDERARLGVDLWLNHWGADFDEVITHPANYGLTNTTARCAGREIFSEDPTPVGDPDTYFFYHSGHPSTAVHRFVGRQLAAEVKAHDSASQP